MGFHSETQLVALLGLVHLWVPFTSFVLVEPGAGINVASVIVPCFMVISF
jgi:hypothetical protein